MPVVPAAARALGARSQVWLAAIIPGGQRSMLDEVSAAPSEILTAVKVTTGGSPPPIPCSRAISLISPGEIDVALGDLAVVVAYQLHAHKRIGQGHVWMVVGSLGGLSDRGDEAEADDEVAGKEPRVGGWASLRQSSSPARRGSACWSFSISSACDWTDRRAFGDHGGSG